MTTEQSIASGADPDRTEPDRTEPDNAEPYNAAAWLIDRHLTGGNADRVALRFRDETLTYAEVHHGVVTRQAALGRLGVGRGERVAMIVKDEPAFISWFLGMVRAGAIPVPLSTMLTASDLGAIVADAEATSVVVSGAYAGLLTDIVRIAPTLRSAVVMGEASVPEMPFDVVADHTLGLDGEPPPVAATTRRSPAFWLYSSGTTGSPKGVMHRHGSLEATYTTYARSVLDMRADDRVLSVAKLFFAFGLGNSLTFPFGAGARAVLHPDPPTPAAIAALLVEERPTLFFTPPGFAAALLDAEVDPAAFSSVRLTVTAGEALPADLSRRFTERFGHPVLDGLGTTEALHIFVSNRIDDVCGGTSGVAVEGYEVELRSEEGEAILDADVPGYLHVRGPSIADGYWRKPVETAAAFGGGWLRTGDVYVRQPEGHLRFLGRNNDMIKAGGIWVSPAEVESVLVAHPDVLEAAVVGARSDEGLEQTVAFVVARAGRTIDTDALDTHCRVHMAAFKRPRRIVAVDTLPKTATGKIRRFALREQLRD